jgi:hypothetical protein
MPLRLALCAASLLAAATGFQGAQPPPDGRIAAILARVSEEAEVFRMTAVKMLAQETLEQRALQPPRRFRPRLGKAPLQPPKPEYRTRVIVSEYGFSTFQAAPKALHELRQVVSVDGRRVASQEKARRTLTIGLRSEDDALKKRMLEAFEKHGLVGAVTDFGQVLLLFARRRLDDYTFRLEGGGMVGAEAATILHFQQRGGPGALLIFEKRKAIHQPLEGQLWVRRSDWRPLRVVLRSATKEGERVTRHEATVDYDLSHHGVLVPVSVVHRQFAGPNLVVENVFRYSPFRLFSADSEMKFSEPAPEK